MGRRLIQMLALLLVMAASPGLTLHEYIQITGTRVRLRSGPGTSTRTVTTALRGDVFEVEGEARGWYRIRLFSGDSRYVHGRLARKISYTPEVPESPVSRQEIFRAFREAEQRARREADQRYPPNTNLERNIEQGRLLVDRYKLEVVHRFKTQAPVHRRIAIEGNQKGW